MSNRVYSKAEGVLPRRYSQRDQVELWQWGGVVVAVLLLIVVW